MVVEADESDGTFNRLPATIAIVTNIDPEHMEHWGTIEALRKGFLDFVSNIPFYGLAVCCTDHPEVQALVGRVTDRRVRTFGFNAQADVRATRPDLRERRRAVRRDPPGRGRPDRGHDPAHAGDHNVSNALAAIAVARHLGMSKDAIRTALAGFGGVNRRFTKVGEVNGVTVIDDYGHHRWRSRPCSRPHGRPPEAGSSLSTSRTATRVCRISSKSSAPVSTRLTSWALPMSMPPARRPSPEPRATTLFRG
jgi:UDP-N-acetylmuramate--alanine ligase